MKRHKMNRSSSKKLFSRTAGANHVHPKNIQSGSSGSVYVMRGGIRL